MAEYVRENGLRAFASSFLLWEVALNVLLFVPFGIIMRRLLELPRWAVLLAGIATTFGIEATQATANWGLSPCPYRVADINDLVTNTTGVIVGLGLERITPRLLASSDQLIAQRDNARPLTRRRRFFGMFLDLLFLGCAWLAGIAAVMGVLLLLAGGDGDKLVQLQEQAGVFIHLVPIAAMLAVVLIPALVGSGASLGQRTVFLQPVAPNDSRLRLVLRALLVQGLFAVPTLELPLGIPGFISLWLLAAFITAVITPQGLSCLVTGCVMTDSRATRQR